MKMNRLLALALSSFFLACAADPPPPAQTPMAPMAPAYTAPVGSAPPPAGQDPQQSNVSISDAIRKACGISETEAYFAFNSSNVRPQDKAVLKKLATCFATGPLKGKQMRIVGHADSRGEDEYNMVLGEKRASNVKGAIGREGLALGQMETNSRGEMDAKGSDEASWEKDRRVDITLAE
ncbi:MAG: OmpA family protein [Polyangiaceae bacterium]|nr:OmpA family protein [Polyangiaceae bacterium]